MLVGFEPTPEVTSVHDTALSEAGKTTVVAVVGPDAGLHIGAKAITSDPIITAQQIRPIANAIDALVFVFILDCHLDYLKH
jgi:hypothetical protein